MLKSTEQIHAEFDREFPVCDGLDLTVYRPDDKSAASRRVRIKSFLDTQRIADLEVVAERLDEYEDQPCEHYKPGEETVLGDPYIHQCPKCGGSRAFCENCKFDHHKGGWHLCFLRTEIEALKKKV